MSKKTTIRLKELENQKIKLEEKIKSLKSEENVLTKNITITSQKLSEVKSSIANIKNNNKNIIISDHAIVRYVERVIGINLEEIESKICPEATRSQIRAFGSGSYQVNSNEFTIKIKDNVVITLIKN